MPLFYGEEVMKHHARQISIYLFLLMQPNDTFIPFNQRLSKSARGDRAAAVIIDVSGNPGTNLLHSKYMKGFLSFTLRRHQPQQIFIDCLLYVGRLLGARKENLKFPKDFERGKIYTLEVSYLPLK